jgi:hypothetical protein
MHVMAQQEQQQGMVRHFGKPSERDPKSAMSGAVNTA